MSEARPRRLEANRGAEEPAPAPGNLPLPISSFVGRERELAALAKLLAAERLVTLTGPGGSGKTRLALASARRAVPHLQHGAWLVDLAPLRDPALVPQAIATTLGVREQGGSALVFTLIAWLQPRRCLLLLDNCEHLVDACAAIVDRLLRACPGLVVLATSREALGITGEVVRAVPALALPAGGAPDVVAIAASEAVQLFVARAAAQQAGFALSDANAAAVAHICRRLDGLPLAIELAAARAALLSPAQIAERLEDNFSLLAGSDRMAPVRHRTLRAAVEWSFNLLSSDTQRCFRQLSVFAGNFDLEAAEAVCGSSDGGNGQWAGRSQTDAQRHSESGSRDGRETLDTVRSTSKRSLLPAARRRGPVEPYTPILPTASVLDLLGRLVAQSLVTVVPGDGPRRFRLLATLRAYAHERLEASGELETARRRHADHYVGIATRAGSALDGAEQAAWLARLDHEYDDLRAALRFLAQHDEREAALRLAVSIRRFWEVRGYLSEGIGWLLGLLEEPAGVAIETRARGLLAVGFLIWKQGDPARARTLLDDARVLFLELGDRAMVACCLLEIGNTLHIQQEVAEARGYYEEALVISRELGDTLNMARLLSNLAMVAYAQAELAPALVHVQEAIVLQEQAGNQHGLAVALTNLSEIVYARGEPAAASTIAERALAIFRALGNDRIAGAVLNNLALFALACERFDRARAHAEAALDLLEPAGDQVGASSAHERLALATARLGDYAGAVEHLRAALVLKRSINYPVELARGLETAMQLTVLLGHWTRAARLYGAARALREAAQQPLAPFVRDAYEQTLEPARHALGATAFAAACVAGQALTQDEAIGEALAGASTSGTPGAADEAVAEPPSPFTAREAEVIRLLVSGRSNKEIAQALLMSVRTVERHITNAYGKIGAAGRSDAISYVLRHALHSDIASMN